jgi:hypothetical protein
MEAGVPDVHHGSGKMRPHLPPVVAVVVDRLAVAESRET